MTSTTAWPRPSGSNGLSSCAPPMRPTRALLARGAHASTTADGGVDQPAGGRARHRYAGGRWFMKAAHKFLSTTVSFDLTSTAEIFPVRHAPAQHPCSPGRGRDHIASEERHTTHS